MSLLPSLFGFYETHIPEMPFFCGVMGLQQQLGISFRFMNSSLQGDWLNESHAFDKEFGKWVSAVIANGFWFLWSNQNNAKFRNHRTRPSSLVHKVWLYAHNYFALRQQPKDGPRLQDRNQPQSSSPTLSL